MTLANKITTFRIILIPFFVLSLLFECQYCQYFSLGLFSLAVVSDGLDGLAARRKKQKTKTGAFLDPLADKLLLASAFIVLAKLGKIPIWAPIIIIGRDLFIVLGWLTLSTVFNKNAVIPSALGKLTTFLQMGFVFLILLFPLLPPRPLFDKVALYTLWTTIIFTILSGIDYGLAARERIGKS